MPPSKIEKLLIKYVSQSATSQDLESLELWLKDSPNLSLLKEYIKTQFAIQMSMNDPDSDEIRERLLKEMRKDKNVFQKRRFRSVLKYAAIAVFFVSLGYYFKNNSFAEKNIEPIVPKEDLITLQLENGDIEVLAENGTSQILNSKGKIVGKQSGNSLKYNGNKSIKQLVHNTITVPYGKRFDIILSDSTQIYLNSGSKLKYPVQFLKGRQRQVFLEGEAFFEVAHDSEHPFLVNTQELGIEVLGTRFNVSNYDEDQDTDVVLVNGSLQLGALENLDSDNRVLLKPGYKASFNKSEKNFSAEVVNTSVYTSWVKGQIVFRNSPFENIIQKLERHYNVIIINNNEVLSYETFNATIDVETEGIEQVLDYFNRIYEIEYEIFNNKIIIN